MTLSPRFESLKKRHATIEEQIKLEESYRAPDVALLQQLKREKLFIKDEMSRLDLEQEKAA